VSARPILIHPDALLTHTHEPLSLLNIRFVLTLLNRYVMIASSLLFNNAIPMNTVPCSISSGASARLPESSASMRGDMHLGRRKAGEKSSFVRAGRDWYEPEEEHDDPYQRTPALPKAGRTRRMARNPSMTAAKTAVLSTPTNRNSGPASVGARG